MTNILMSRSEALTSSWAIEHTSKILTKDMKVAVLGFSFFGNPSKEDYDLMYNPESEYYAKIKANFEVFGISKVDWIYYHGMDKDEMLKVLNNADVLYLPGGAPDLMYERIIEKNILEELKSFNGVVIGSSAGAMIQLEHYHISPDNEYFKFSEHEGLGFINEFFIEVHYRRRKKQKASLRKMRKNYKKPTYIIPDDGMIIVENNKITCLNTAKQYSNTRKKL